jgi:phosphoesterase RecJ-like protein
MCHKAGAEPRDAQEFVSPMRLIKGVKVAVLFRFMRQTNKIKVSFRTDGEIDASELARYFGGGGHRRASGCTLEGDPHKVEQQVLQKIRKMLAQLG